MNARHLSALILATAIVSGCDKKEEQTSSTASAPKAELRGVVRSPGLPRPHFVLRTMKGDTFDFFERTKGRVTLLFYGYTNCPDVCPATMAIVSRALKQLTSDQRGNLDFVFVTTDPERDTPEVLAPWLEKFDNEIIGLTGTPAQVATALRAGRVGASKSDTTNLQYEMSHSAQVFVYSPDDSAHVEYPSGYREADFVNDIPKLLTKWPAKT